VNLKISKSKSQCESQNLNVNLKISMWISKSQNLMWISKWYCCKYPIWCHHDI